MKITEYVKAKRLFTDLFDLRLSDFYDWELTFIFGTIQINIIKFDDWLHEKYGDYEQEGFTMQSLVVDKYSVEAWQLIDQLTDV